MKKDIQENEDRSRSKQFQQSSVLPLGKNIKDQSDSSSLNQSTNNPERAIRNSLEHHKQYTFHCKTQKITVQYKIIQIFYLIIKKMRQEIDKKLESSKKKQKYMIYFASMITIVKWPRLKNNLTVRLLTPLYQPNKCSKAEKYYIMPSSRQKLMFDEKDVIYSIGMMLHQCLVGSPFLGKRQKYHIFQFVQPQIRKLLIDIVSNGMKIHTLLDLEQRFQIILKKMKSPYFIEDCSSIHAISQEQNANQIQSWSICDQSAMVLCEYAQSKQTENSDGLQENKEIQK